MRKDSEETYRKILEAAFFEFGANGYHKATHAAICARAHANIAAINYHFGSKRTLYRTVWQYAYSKTRTLYPLDGGVKADAPPEKRLEALIHALIYQRTDKQLKSFHNMKMREMFSPTGIVNDLIGREIRKLQQTTQEIAQDILGPKATQEDIALSELTTVAPILFATPSGEGLKRVKPDIPPPPWLFAMEAPEQLFEHITHFVLGGLQVTRQRIEERNT